VIKATLSSLVAELAKLQDVKMIGQDVEVNQIVTDSRADCSQGLFVALRGPHFDAHDFLPQVISQGAKALVVENESALDIPQIIVKNSKATLGHLARINRNKIDAKFVAITGSSGKTTVKEMIATVLQKLGSTHATKGNFNNEIGVPLTLLDMSKDYDFGVIELGASQAGEIAYTAAITNPDVAMINNVAAAHLQGFGDLHGVARAKGEIYSELKSDGIAVVNNDDNFSEYWKKQISNPIITFGSQSEADVTSNNVQLDSNQCPHFELEYKGEKCFVRLSLAGLHNVNNALAAAACCLALGVSLKEIAAGLSQAPVVSGRLMTEILANGCRVIDDSYNANLDSMKAAINLLSQYKGRKILVIGDIAELGEFGRQCHEEVGQLAKDSKIDKMYSCGVLTQFSQTMFTKGESGVAKGEHFSSQQQLIKKIITEAAMKPSQNGETTILIKGSRSAHMENVVLALTECSKQILNQLANTNEQFLQSEEH
jgi:UDP-N-acetylmuramoyl-tripeptide--D-alanyl-D-alanine ligase